MLIRTFEVGNDFRANQVSVTGASTVQNVRYRVSIMACLISIGCVTSYRKNSNLMSFSNSNSVFSIMSDTPNAY